MSCKYIPNPNFEEELKKDVKKGMKREFGVDNFTFNNGGTAPVSSWEDLDKLLKVSTESDIQIDKITKVLGDPPEWFVEKYPKIFKK